MLGLFHGLYCNPVPDEVTHCDETLYYNNDIYPFEINHGIYRTTLHLFCFEPSIIDLFNFIFLILTVEDACPEPS